jgi:hypothetical protein
MFHIDATFEDTRMIARSEDGHTYQVMLSDSDTLNTHGLELTQEQLAMVMAFNLHNDGEPQGYEKFYEVLEPLLVDCPPECRPIP